MTFQCFRRFVTLAAIPFIFGCAGLPDAPREVLVPVAVSCLTEIPAKPVLVTDAQLLLMPDAPFILALAADRLERAKYMAVADALLTACVK